MKLMENANSRELVAARIVIQGIVQGVGFRYGLRRYALENGLIGWVRNLTDGTVEAHFEGSREEVERAIEWCKKGPPGAKVENVSIKYMPPEGGLRGFRILPTKFVC